VERDAVSEPHPRRRFRLSPGRQPCLAACSIGAAWRSKHHPSGHRRRQGRGPRPLAHALGLPLLAIGAQALAAMPTRPARPRSLAARGTGSLAEAAALAGARMLNPEASSPSLIAPAAFRPTAAPRAPSRW
jgi:hypothetical protein